MPNLPISAEFENHVTTKFGDMARYLTFISKLQASGKFLPWQGVTIAPHFVVIVEMNLPRTGGVLV